MTENDGTPNPSSLLDTLRKTLVTFRRRLDETSKEVILIIFSHIFYHFYFPFNNFLLFQLVSVKTLYEKSTSESIKLKESINRKDKALEVSEISVVRHFSV